MECLWCKTSAARSLSHALYTAHSTHTTHTLHVRVFIIIFWVTFPVTYIITCALHTVLCSFHSEYYFSLFYDALRRYTFDNVQLCIDNVEATYNK